MPNRAKVTPVIIPQIGVWLEQGLCAKEIAKKIGCTYGTLRVRCSQLGISLRRRGNPQHAETAAAGQERPVRKHIQVRNRNRTRELLSVVEAPSVEPHHVPPSEEFLLPNRLHSCAKGVHAEGLERLVIMLPESTAQQLSTRATSKGLSETIFASTLLQMVVQDDLFEAVLDES